MRDLIRTFVPPLALHIARKLRQRQAVLFDGDSAMFEREARSCEIYGEYGVGMSTVHIAQATKAKILAVDTSEAWIKNVLSDIGPSDRFGIEWVDLGPLGNWGRPLSYAKRGDFERYRSSIWQRGAQPDLVLVDGRFRVACILHSLLHAGEGTRIIVDDYVGRSFYEIVEEFAEVKEYCGRQVLLEKKKSTSPDTLRDMIKRFEYVMD